MESGVLILLCVLTVLTGYLCYALQRKAKDKSADAATEERLRAELKANERLYEERIKNIQDNFEKYIKRIEDERLSIVRDMEMRLETERRNMADASALRFEKLASDLLKANASELKSANSEQIEALLAPLRDNIDGFKKAVDQCYISENASRKSLTDQIERLMQLNHSIGEEARNLTSALKGNSKVQGDWGEMVLESLLENAGLLRDVNFAVQVTKDADGNVVRDNEGRLQRPDVIVYMPDNHHIIIDSKVSLSAFADLCAASDKNVADAAMKRHLASVRAHIDELADKAYQDNFKNSADYVMMFIPNEGAYIAAAQADPSLWEYAFSRKVAIVSPTHLFSVMKIVTQLWKQDTQNRNVIAIANRGRELYAKITRFVGEFVKIDKNLELARKSYSDAYKLLVTGRGNVIRQTEMLRELGIDAQKSLPQDIVADAEIGENSELESPSIQKADGEN